MEREILFTGIGGQSIQLAAQILARAAVHEGRHVLYLGTYGGTMRGGPTESTLLVADGPLESPPIVSKSWSALAMHDRFWESIAHKLRPHGVVVVNASLFGAPLDRTQLRVLEVPATDLASEAGSPLAASMVLTAAYARFTGLLALDSLIAAMHESVPSYRRQHLVTNEQALRAGFEAAPAGGAPAWEEAA